MLKRKLIAIGLTAVGVAGALAFDEYQALRTERTSWLMTTIGAPFCAPDRAGPQYKTFFRVAMAQAESTGVPRKTEVGPFSRAIPDAESLAKADANPVLMDNLGNMQYRVTTSVPEAQQFFDQGLRLAYAFNHAEALRAFRKARTLDPGCAMCWWGEALVLGPNINAPMDANSVPAAIEAIAGAKSATAKATPKERALVDAVAARYAAEAGADRSALDKAYAGAMEKVAARYPEDAQIAVLFAESLMDLQPWDYWEGGSKPKGRAADIQAQLEKALNRMPDHPGAIHYYIHLVEASADPKRALPHAQRLGKLMPGAGHVVHMPFHTFFRVGMFKEAVEANKQAVAADEAFIAKSTPVGLYPMAYYPHNVHSLLVSAQMAGDGATVIEAADKLEQIVSESAAKKIPWVQPIKAAPFFAHAQFSDGQTILGLPDPGSDFPYVQAMWHYARAVAFAQQGRIGNATNEVAEIARIEQANDFADLAAGGVPAKEVLRLAQSVAKGRIAQAAKDTAGAVGHFEAAVKQEDVLNYSEPPFWYYPTRQSLGAAYLAAGNLEKAEDTLRASLARTPNNGWALYGLVQVYEQRGDNNNARAARRLLDNAWMGDEAALELERL